MVGASLSSACGLAGASVFPTLPVPVWGAIHAIVAALLVALNRYSRFQLLMKLLIAAMALCVFVCALLARPDPAAVLTGMALPRWPAEGAGAVLALLGGIGGSLTVICYGYWLREEGWQGADKLPVVRRDAGLAYVFTGAFGLALVVIAAGTHPGAAEGTRIALEVAARLEGVAGPVARALFLSGFWCTVFTAMLGVWQGVPQVYADVAAAWRGRAADAERDRPVFLAALAWLALPPLVLLWFKQPVVLVLAFSVVGAFIMPFLAATLLWLNNRRDWMGSLANRLPGNLALVICLLVFGAVCAREIWQVTLR